MSKSPASALGLIDLLAITLVVILLQVVSIINIDYKEEIPQKKAFNISIYQPAEKPENNGDHLNHVMFNDQLWSANYDSVVEWKREIFNATSMKWEEQKPWEGFGSNSKIKQSYGRDEFALFAETVKKLYGVELSMKETTSFPRRINVFFTEEIKNFHLEVGYYPCNCKPGMGGCDPFLGHIHPINYNWQILDIPHKQGKKIFNFNVYEYPKWDENTLLSLHSESYLNNAPNQKVSANLPQCASGHVKECFELASFESGVLSQRDVSGSILFVLEDSHLRIRNLDSSLDYAW